MSLLRRDPKAAEVKRERMGRILRAARDCLGRLPATRITLQTVARHAGVNEGLPSMYFGSLEELAAKVAATELGEWAASTVAEIAVGDAPTPDAAARHVAALVAGRPFLTRVLAVVPPMLESASDADPALAVAGARESAVTAVARALAEACPDLSEPAAEALVERLLVFAAGLEPRARPLGGLALAAAGDDGVDATAELERVAAALVAASILHS